MGVVALAAVHTYALLKCMLTCAPLLTACLVEQGKIRVRRTRASACLVSESVNRELSSTRSNNHLAYARGRWRDASVPSAGSLATRGMKPPSPAPLHHWCLNAFTVVLMHYLAWCLLRPQPHHHPQRHQERSTCSSMTGTSFRLTPSLCSVLWRSTQATQ